MMKTMKEAPRRKTRKMNKNKNNSKAALIKHKIANLLVVRRKNQKAKKRKERKAKAVVLWPIKKKR